MARAPLRPGSIGRSNDVGNDALMATPKARLEARLIRMRGQALERARPEVVNERPEVRSGRPY